MMQTCWVDSTTLEVFFYPPEGVEVTEMEFPVEVLQEADGGGLTIGRRFLTPEGTVRVEVAPEIGRKKTLEEMVDGAITDLEAAQTLLASRTPTAAETRQILRLLVRCVLGVVRLLRNRV